MTGQGEAAGGRGVEEAVQGPPPGYETAIGVEVHVQLRTETKLFCGCRVEFGARPNEHVCPVCLGLPGALPVPNREAVALGVRAALALDCRVEPVSEWVRKNYFYPDLPKGYQISQYRHPLARDGRVVLRRDGRERAVGVRRLHLEEDAGKSVHDRVPGRTAVDLNRTGVPLAEIVSEPEIRSPAEARAYLDRLKQVLEHFAAVSDCNMEEGSLRVDANLSVRPEGHGELGTKTEVKNLNSFRNAERALAHEQERQVRVLEEGGEVSQETRRWDDPAGRTVTMRGKEEALDYRYFPDPDLPPLRVSEDRLERTRAELPAPPHRVERELAEEWGLSEYDASRLAATPERASYVRRAAEGRGPEFAKQAANFVLGAVAETLNRREDGATEADAVPAEALARVVELRQEGTLSSTTADRALELMFSGREPPDPDAVVEEHGLAQVRDESELRGWVEDAVASNPEEARRYVEGEEKLLGFFMGQVMQRAGGKADPEKTREMLREAIPAEAPPPEAD